MPDFPSDWEIANAAKMRPIVDVARDRLGIPHEAVEPYGHYKAKIGLPFVDQVMKDMIFTASLSFFAFL